jgi:mono/diheme cytochrome c family protein
MKRELLALGIVLLILVAFPASLFAYQAWRSNAAGVRVIDLVGHAPANGGWQPDALRVNLGEHVRLRISSPDVVHGFEIPALGIRVDEILPGHVEQVEFTATQVGRFPFACTRWCSPDHWRMRGVIEVDDSEGALPLPTSAPPLFQQMHIDIDAMHPASAIPSEKPSAARGALLHLSITEDLRTRSPSEVFAKTRAAEAFRAYSDQELWDTIAFAYRHSVGDEAIARGQQLFARGCAACHGEAGKGNGPAGINLPGLTAMDPGAKKGPADFTDASQMLGASDVLLQGKILRGGMGTGMPEWGSLYSEQDMWDVISFLRSFIFDYGLK